MGKITCEKEVIIIVSLVDAPLKLAASEAAFHYMDVLSVQCVFGSQYCIFLSGCFCFKGCVAVIVLELKMIQGIHISKQISWEALNKQNKVAV